MLDFNIPQQYVAKAQQIVGAVSTEVTHETFGEVLSSYLDAASRGANGNLRIQTVTFGENENEIRDLQSNTIGIVRDVLERDNTAMLLSNSDGAVFCLACVQVGEKTYLQFLNPQMAMAIRDEQRALLDGMENPPAELTLYEKICDLFARLFLGRSGEAAGRAQAYRTFYANMQRNVDKVSTLAQSDLARSYDPRRFVVERPVEQHPIEQQPIEQQPENAPVNDVPQPVPEVEARNQFENVLETSVIDEADEDAENADLAEENEAKRQAELKQKEEAEKLRLQKEEEERLRLLKEQEEKQRQLLLKQREEEEARLLKQQRIQNFKTTIKQCQEKLGELKKVFDPLDARVQQREKEISALYYHEKHGSKAKAQMEQELEKWVNELKDVEDKIKANEYKKGFDDRKKTAAEKLEQKRVKLEDKKTRLEQYHADLRSAQMELTIASYYGKKDGAWVSPKEYLEMQYNREKSVRDTQFEAEQALRDNQMAEQKKTIDIYTIKIKQFTDKLGYWKRNKGEDKQLADYEKILKEAKQQYKQMEKENTLAQKQHEAEEAAHKKELLSPTKEKLQETEAKLQKVKADTMKALKKHDAVALSYDLLKNDVSTLEEEYKKAQVSFHKKYIEKPERFDEVLHESLTKQKGILVPLINNRKLDIAKNEKLTENLPTLLRDALTLQVNEQKKHEQLAKEIRETERKLGKAQTDYQNEIQMKPKNQEPEKKDEGMGLGGL